MVPKRMIEDRNGPKRRMVQTRLSTTRVTDWHRGGLECIPENPGRNVAPIRGFNPEITNLLWSLFGRRGSAK
jgi:hypothetical protein